MAHDKLKAIYARKISEAKAEQARYQSLIDNAQPGESKRQIGVWRSRAVRWKKQAKALECRLEKI